LKNSPQFLTHQTPSGSRKNGIHKAGAIIPGHFAIKVGLIGVKMDILAQNWGCGRKRSLISDFQA
jgi:hypothetical protein